MSEPPADANIPHVDEPLPWTKSSDPPGLPPEFVEDWRALDRCDVDHPRWRAALERVAQLTKIYEHYKQSYKEEVEENATLHSLLQEFLEWNRQERWRTNNPIDNELISRTQAAMEGK